MDQHPPQKKNKTLLIVLIAIGVIGLFSVLCCGVLGYFGLQTVQDIDTAYYAECEDLQDSNLCSQCCRDRGHSGHVYGDFLGLNEEGKMCGCIGAGE